MRILCVLCRDPFEAQDGGTYAMRASLAALARRGEVSLTGFSPSFDEGARGGYRCRGALGTASNGIGSFLRSTIQGRSFSIDKYGSPAAQARLAALLRNGDHDVVWYEQTQAAAAAHLGGLLRDRSLRAAHVLRSHNLEHEVIRDREGPLAAVGAPLLALESRRLRRDELEIVRAMDAVLTVTDEDRQHLAGAVPGAELRHLPVPAGAGAPPAGPPADPPRIAFVGKCTWGPNVAAARWLLRSLAPALERALPAARIVLIGEGTEGLARLVRSGNVQCAGFVPDLAAALAGCLCTVAPVRTGGGVNVKVLDALARGLPVVGTRFARRGVPGDGYLVAETVNDFVARIGELAHDPGRAAGLGAAAREAAARMQLSSGAVLDAALEAALRRRKAWASEGAAA